jgi:hypothetical protein
MGMRLALIVSAILALVFGVLFYLVPTQAVASFGVIADQSMQHMTRNYGSALIGLAALAWFARDAPDSVARRAIFLGLFVYFTLGSISIALFQLTGIPNVGGWFPFAFHVPLAIAFGYFLFANRGAPAG